LVDKTILKEYNSNRVRSQSNKEYKMPKNIPIDLEVKETDKLEQAVASELEEEDKEMEELLDEHD